MPADSIAESTSHNLKRRGFLRGLLAALGGALALGGGGYFWLKRRSRRRPNIVFIMADDLGYGDLGAYGQEVIQTPNLDALAAQGMRFTQAYAASPTCSPSRACLMTGLHTGHVRIRNTKTNKGERLPLKPEDFTVAELLKSAGYTTAIFGKWGIGKDGTVDGPTGQGFDTFFGRVNDYTDIYYPEMLWNNTEKVKFEENQDGQKGTYSQDLLTERALDFIQDHRHEPFFLYLAYNIPHAGKTLETATDNTMHVPSDEPYSDQPWPQAEKNYAAMITRLDGEAGKIVSRLEELGLDRNTIVFFSSDNGPTTEGGHDSGFFDSSGPLRGGKRELYEGGVRVPMIAWWPGTIEAGVVSDQALAFWDFLPTAAELAGAELPPDRAFDGLSMLPTLLGEPQQGHEFLYWEYPDKDRLTQAVRMGDWKGHRRDTHKDIHLFDLEGDIEEAVDVAADHPEIVAEIARIMETEHIHSEDFPAT